MKPMGLNWQEIKYWNDLMIKANDIQLKEMARLTIAHLKRRVEYYKENPHICLECGQEVKNGATNDSE